MGDLEDLIEEYGEADEIPDSELEEIGYTRNSDGEIISVDDFLLDLPDQENDEEEEEPKEEEPDNDAFQAYVEFDKEKDLEEHLYSPIGDMLSDAFKNAIREKLKYDDYGEEDSVPERNFLMSANAYLASHEVPVYASLIFERIGKEIFEYPYKYDEGNVTAEEFHEAMKGALDEAQRSFDTENIPQKIIDDFERKYGPKNFASGVPFVCYAFTRLVLKQEDPSFFGMSLFEMRKKFIEKFADVPGIERLADEIYEESAGYLSPFSDYICSGKNVSDAGLPESVTEFEELREKKPTAVAFIEAPGHSIEDYYLYEAEWLRDVLIELHKKEHPELFEKTPVDPSLERLVTSASKREKILALCNVSSEYEKWVKKFCNGDEDYVNRLKANKETTKELENLGVNTGVFYNGIKPLEFVVEGNQAVDVEEVKQRFMKDYTASMEKLFSGKVVHAPDRLKQKIIAELKKDVDILKLEDKESLRKVCRVSIEYASRPQYLIDSQAASAAVHHLRSLGSLFKKSKKKEEEKSRRYTVKLSEKNPLMDVDIGNDGGCCIGIYRDQFDPWEERDGCVDRFIDYLNSGGRRRGFYTEENGDYVPFYLKDKATQFVEIYRDDRRVGMALMFAGKTRNKKPVLMINSIEGSDKLKRDPNFDIILKQTIAFIKDYSNQSGFAKALMGSHAYNPAENHGNKRSKLKPVKVDHWNEHFYSDILFNLKADNMKEI